MSFLVDTISKTVMRYDHQSWNQTCAEQASCKSGQDDNWDKCCQALFMDTMVSNNGCMLFCASLRQQTKLCCSSRHSNVHHIHPPLENELQTLDCFLYDHATKNNSFCMQAWVAGHSSRHFSHHNWYAVESLVTDPPPSSLVQHTSPTTMTEAWDFFRHWHCTKCQPRN